MVPNTYFLIDDDEDDREIFELATEEVNSENVCLTCQNGKEALRLLVNKEIIPTHIFIDINMPRMNGKECLAAIRELSHLNSIPVFMYTTSSDVKDKSDFIALGARAIITKPAKISQLVILLGNLPDNQ
jgi:DNA-binding response OmpR family regulator